MGHPFLDIQYLLGESEWLVPGLFSSSMKSESEKTFSASRARPFIMKPRINATFGENKLEIERERESDR